MRQHSVRHFATSPNVCPSCHAHIRVQDEECGNCSFSFQRALEVATAKHREPLIRSLGYFSDFRSTPLSDDQITHLDDRLRSASQDEFSANPCLVLLYSLEEDSLLPSELSFVLLNQAGFPHELDLRHAVLFTFGVSESEVIGTATPGYKVEPFFPHDDLSALVSRALHDPSREEVIDVEGFLESYQDLLRTRSEIAQRTLKEVRKKG